MRSWQLSKEHPRAKSLKAPQRTSRCLLLQAWQLGLAGRAEHSPWAALAPSEQARTAFQHFPVLSHTEQCYQKPQAEQGAPTVAGGDSPQRKAGEPSSRLSPGEAIGIYLLLKQTMLLQNSARCFCRAVLHVLLLNTFSELRHTVSSLSAAARAAGSSSFPETQSSFLTQLSKY